MLGNAMTRRSLDDRKGFSRTRVVLTCLVLAASSAALPGCLDRFEDWPNAGTGNQNLSGSSSASGALGNAGAVGVLGSSGAGSVPGVGGSSSVTAGSSSSGSAGGSGGAAAGSSSGGDGGAFSAGGSGDSGGAFNAGGSGGVSGSSGVSGSGGNGNAGGHRYARLLALTSIPNDSLTSVAEFVLLDAQGNPLDRRGWTVSADSQELNVSYCPASNAIDGDTTTVWQTEWGNELAPLPHYLNIDMGAQFVVSGFIYTPRQDWYSGRIGAWEFYLSDDSTNWGTPVVSGNFSDTMDVQSRTFTAQ